MPRLDRTFRSLPFGQLLAACAACLILLSAAVGQSPRGTQATAKNPPPPAPLPDFASMAQAVLTQDYTVVQLRRFREPNGNVVTVRERLAVAANGTTRPDFELTFLAVEGEPAGSPLSLEWQQKYARFATLFFRHGSFKVRDLVEASGNYSLHDFGQVVRAGRVARRMVVFPNTMDKAIWVIDVDTATSVPLFVAEFDSQLRVFAEIEASSFTGSVQSLTPTVPSATVTPMPDFAAAYSLLGAASEVIEPNVLAMPDYELERVEVHTDPLNGQQKLVMSYSDGIDQFLVVQAVNTIDPFAGMPASAAGGNTIGRFRDAAVSALVFWDDGVTFHVAGRGALERLDDVARDVYLQALSN